MNTREICPLDHEPCRGGCHDSEMCARWGVYSCIAYVPRAPLRRREISMPAPAFAYISEGLDQHAQQIVEGIREPD